MTSSGTGRLLRARKWPALMVGSGLSLLAVVIWTSPPLDAGMRDELRARGRIVVAGPDRWLRLRPEGTALAGVEDVPGMREALAGDEAEVVARTMDLQGVAGLLVEAADGSTAGDTVLDRLGRAAYVSGLQGRYLTPEATLYLRDDTVEIDPPLDDALATVARRIVGGATPPRVASFPEPLRRVRNVEVMVMLEERGQAKLWRSARGGSIARALITAAVVARRRWAEREHAMGGPLDARLPRLDVEVSLLREDGTLGARQPDFIERVFTPAHGVAYEGKGSWRYLLPKSTRDAGGGSALRAYESLLAEHALAGSSLTRPDLRLYRLVVVPVGRSTALPADYDPLEALEPSTDGPATPASSAFPDL